MKGPYKITVEGSDGQSLSLEFDHIHVSQEVGWDLVDDGAPVLRPRPNGMGIAVIKAWKGCEKFEDFRTSGPYMRKATEKKGD